MNWHWQHLRQHSLGLVSPLGRLGNLVGSSSLFVQAYDDIRSNSQPHVTKSKMTLRRARVSSAHAGLPGNLINNGCITRFQDLEAIFQLLSRTVSNLFFQLSRQAGWVFLTIYTGTQPVQVWIVAEQWSQPLPLLSTSLITCNVTISAVFDTNFLYTEGWAVPGRSSLKASLCLWADFITSAVALTGTRLTTMLSLRPQASNRPQGSHL